MSSSPDTIAADYETPATSHALPLRFTGSGSEYFRIWIVNALLSVVTLGIYSAWAKVRTLQYFYRNTELDGATFDYHGRPLAILKGRAIVLVLMLAFNMAGQFSVWLPLLLGLALVLVFPPLLVRSLRFRLANSSYRGLRFAFTGGDAGGYRVFLLWPLATAATLGMLAPLAHQRFKQYQHEHTRYGTVPFAFSAHAGAFYGVYLRTFAMMLGLVVIAALCGIAIGVGLGSLLGHGPQRAMLATALSVGAFYVASLAIGPFFLARLQNLVWNHTTLGPHRFRSEVGAFRYFCLVLSNLVGIVLTLGLFAPFARVRALRYRLACVTLLAAGPLDSFVAGEAEQVGALGDAAVDWYDIDIAL